MFTELAHIYGARSALAVAYYFYLRGGRRHMRSTW